MGMESKIHFCVCYYHSRKKNISFDLIPVSIFRMSCKKLKCLEFMRKANLMEGGKGISIEGRSEEKDSNEKVFVKVDEGRISR